MIQAGTVISLCEKVRAIRMDGFTDTQRTLCVITPIYFQAQTVHVGDCNSPKHILTVLPFGNTCIFSFYSNVVVEADRQH